VKPSATRVSATLLLTIFLAYFLLPLYWLIVASTKSNDDLFATFGLWFSHVQFENFTKVFTFDDGVYRRWLVNSLAYSTAIALGTALLATLAGYGFAKYRFRGRELLFTIVFGAIMVPFTALVIPTYLQLSAVHLTNTPAAVILPFIANPFSVFLMRVYADSAVPGELLDAARVDGAGEFRIFRNVSFRLLLPGFVTVYLLSFLSAWSNYFLPLVMLSDQRLYPLTVGLAQWNSLSSASGGAQVVYPLVIAGALIAILPVIGVFLLMQRYWQGGLTLGAVK
jgi:multiple sugar transport system permease protein